MTPQEIVVALRERADEQYDHGDYVLMRAAADLIEQQLAHRCGLPSSIIEALNSGDGTYRP